MQLKEIFYGNIKLTETNDHNLIESIYGDGTSEQYHLYKHSINLFLKNTIYKIENCTGDIIGTAALYGVDEINMNACIDVYLNSGNIMEKKQAALCLIKYAFENLNYEKLYAVFTYDDRISYEFWDCLRFVNGGLFRSHKKAGTEYIHIFTKNILKHEYMRFLKNDNNIKKYVLGE